MPVLKGNNMFRRTLNCLMLGLIGLGVPFSASASAIAESIKGDVHADRIPVMQGQRLVPPTAITTGPGAQVFLKFDDGMQIVLSENSLLRMIDFRYSDSGVIDRAVFELLRGAARVVTGKVALNNPKQFFFRTPQTQLMVDKPSDFTVALVNPAYITVHSGSLLSGNGWGITPLGAGSTSVVATSAVGPASIAASSLPAAASGPMGALSAVAVAPPAGSAAAGLAATATGLGGAAVITPVVVGAAVIAGVAAAASDDDDTTQPAATTHH
jgi:hypothetical protein